VRLEDPSDTEQAVSSLAPMADEAPDVEDGLVRVKVRQRTGSIAEAVRRLEGVGIDDIALRRPTLDDVFLALTGHTAEEAEQDEDAEKQEVAA